MPNCTISVLTRNVAGEGKGEGDKEGRIVLAVVVVDPIPTPPTEILANSSYVARY